MKQGILILVLVIAFTALMSRPESVPAHQEIESGPLEPQTPAEARAKEVSISVSPQKILQGDPVLVKFSGLTGTSTIRSLQWNNATVPVFVSDDGHPAAILGIDLRMAAKTYPVTLTLTDGRVIQDTITITARNAPTAPLGIPEKLGGNTPESEKELVNSLVEESKIISAIKSSKERLWGAPFRLPLAGPITITDVYGYSRQTGGSTLAHKGTDFRAAVGTPIYSIADGKVAYVGYLRNYGNIVAVDHGAKILSIYMHLSKVEVAVGESVKKGEKIALSGDTGYVLGPHLHLTIRINDISIDPIKFFELL